MSFRAGKKSVQYYNVPIIILHFECINISFLPAKDSSLQNSEIINNGQQKYNCASTIKIVSVTIKLLLNYFWFNKIII